MCLVDDDGVVGREQRVSLRLGQQNAVRHEFDRRVATQTILKTHLETHHFPQRCFQLLGNAFGHAAGGDTTRLGVANKLATRCGTPIGQGCGVVAQAAPHGKRNFRQLRGFTRAGFAADDDDLMALQCGGDLVAFTRHR